MNMTIGDVKCLFSTAVRWETSCWPYASAGDLRRLRRQRPRRDMTQAHLAEAAELSDRAYADIERGTVNMRMDTILRICRALHVTPDEILTEAEEPSEVRQEDLLARLEACSLRERETALELLSVYLRSLGR